MIDWVELPKGSGHEHLLKSDLARLSFGQKTFIEKVTDEWGAGDLLPDGHRQFGLEVEREDGEAELYLVGATWVEDLEAQSRYWPVGYFLDKLLGSRLLLVTLWLRREGMPPRAEIMRVVRCGEDPFKSVLEAVHQRFAGYRLLSRWRYNRSWKGRAT